jgi:hypothetical protein
MSRQLCMQNVKEILYMLFHFFITSQKKKRQVLNNSFFLYLLSKFTATMPKLSSSPHSIKAISYCESCKVFDYEDYEGAIKLLKVMSDFRSTLCSESHCAARLQYIDLVVSNEECLL